MRSEGKIDIELQMKLKDHIDLPAVSMYFDTSVTENLNYLFPSGMHARKDFLLFRVHILCI